jgi:hypothetical protein
MEDYGFEYSDEEPEEQDVDIENQYYNSKGIISFACALSLFVRVQYFLLPFYVVSLCHIVRVSQVWLRLIQKEHFQDLRK